MKCYAVKVGRKRGIFFSLDLAKEQVEGYKGGVMKTCKSIRQAEQFMRKRLMLPEERQEFFAVVHNGVNEGVYEDINIARKKIKFKKRAYIKKFFSREEAEQYLQYSKEPVFYAVRKGRKTGIFLKLEDAIQQVKGISGAEFKKFTNEREAEDYVLSGILDIYEKDKYVHFWTDGSYLYDLDKTGLGVVVVKNDTVIDTISEVCTSDTSKNVTGELRAAMTAFEIAKERGYKNIAIHYDCMAIFSLTRKGSRPRKEITIEYVNKYNDYKNHIRCIFIKTKSHGSDRYNEMAHNLARFGTPMIDTQSVTL